MSGGKGAQRRGTANNKARKAAARKAARQQTQSVVTLTVPSITEDDLLAFQIAHFGDDGQPSDWFIDVDTALNYDPSDDEDDDGLGYYEDGVKRTLTDDQIEMFRHSEMETMAREEKAQAEEGQDAESGSRDVPTGNRVHEAAVSPISDTSSVEGDLLGPAKVNEIPPTQSSVQREEPYPQSNAKRQSNDPKTRPRTKDIPYDQRHKRKWEAFIDENDPVEGSLTHRRIVRELDEQRNEKIDLDY